MNNKGQLNTETVIGLGIIGFIVLLFGIVLVTQTVNPGEIGVKTTWGSVEPYNLPEGLYFKIPFVQSIHNINTQTQAEESNSSSASKDLQVVSTTVTLQYRIQPDQAYKLFQEIGSGYRSNVIIPAIQEAVKSSTARFTAEQLISQRPLVKVEMENILKDRLARNYIEVQEVSITDFKFSEQFDKAIEAKVTVEQETLQAENELQKIRIQAEQTVTQAKAESDSKMLQADAEAYQMKVVADAEAYRIQVEGETTAEAYRKINEQLSPELVELEKIKKWSGSVPVYNGIGGTPLIDLRVEQ